MNEVIKILKSVGAIITDSHIVGTSGRHMSVYINKDALFPHTEAASMVGKLFAQKYKDADIDTVAAPALGGIVLAQWTAYHLSQMKQKEVYAVYSEKTPEKDHIFTRGNDAFIKEKKVLVVEDTTVTGGSVKKVVESVKKAGGDVVAVCVMVNREPDKINSTTIGAPFSSLAVFHVDSYEPHQCPMCKKGIPVNTSIGHGKEYLEKKT